MTLEELNALPTAQMQLEAVRQLLADRDRHIQELLETNNLELEGKRAAERDVLELRHQIWDLRNHLEGISIMGVSDLSSEMAQRALARNAEPGKRRGE